MCRIFNKDGKVSGQGQEVALKGREKCQGLDRQWTGKEGIGIQARTGSGLGREGQVIRLGYAAAYGGWDSFLSHIKQWLGEGGTSV